MTTTSSPNGYNKGVPTSAPRRPLPPFTQEHEDFRQVVRAFLQKEVRPNIDEWERAKWVPNELFKTFAAQGYLGLKYEEAYGGEGGGYIADAVLVEEMGRCGSGGVAAAIGAHNGIATPPIWKFGTEEQKQRWLVPAIKGEKIGALGITEPEAGSDVAGIRTFAKKVDGGYVVNGAKVFITNGCRADFVVTGVKTTEEGGHQGLSWLVLEKGMEGFDQSKALNKLGWHASDTAELAFDNVFVPDENLLGEENKGFYQMMANFQWERILMALGALGGMQADFDRTLHYAQERQAFGRSIGKFQAIRHKFAAMATKIETSRALTYNTLRMFVEGIDAVREVSMAKKIVTEWSVDVADECVQIHGGWGYMREYEVERNLRDARLGPIGGGTSEIMNEIIGKTYGL